MLLKDILIREKWNVRNIYRFISLGYVFTAYGDYFDCKVEDLTVGSKAIITYICDYCNKIGNRTYQNYMRYYKKSILKKDACPKCIYKKVEETSFLKYGVKSPLADTENIKQRRKTNLIKYGTEFPSQNNEIKEKTKKYFMNKYNVENPFQSKEVKDKIKETNLRKYNVENPMKSKLFKDKLKRSMKAKYGYEHACQNPLTAQKLTRCSKQQKYIHNLLGGELNYLVNISVLDIAFLEEKIYIEYNGGGHDLCVKIGSKTEEEFKNRELKRFYSLKQLGWKNIIIESKKDFIPKDDVLINMIILAKEYLNKNHSWIRFDIDKQKIICSEYEINYDFGELRKIT